MIIYPRLRSAAFVSMNYTRATAAAKVLQDGLSALSRSMCDGFRLGKHSC